MKKILTLEHIKEHIVHRYENLLLDKIIVDEENSGTGQLELSVLENDDLGRQLFFRNKAHSDVMRIPIYMEILALASITSTGKVGEGEYVFFTGISQFKKFQNVSFNEVVNGQVKKVSEKKGFLKYTGELMSSQGEMIAEGTMSAFFMQDETNNEDGKKKQLAVPESNVSLKVNKMNYSKLPEMVIIDELIFSNESEGMGCYTYPSDHSLIKGHFPGNPVMMGVMQWMAIEDCSCIYLEKLEKFGHFTLMLNGYILDKDNHIVAEFKEIKLDAWINVPGMMNQCETLEAKKIIFRGMIKPNDKLMIYLKDIQICSS